MTRRVTLKLTGEIPARGKASPACSLGPGAFTRRTAYIVCVRACLEGSLLFSDTSGTTPLDESHTSYRSPHYLLILTTDSSIITNTTHGSKLAPKKEGGLEKGVGVKPYYDHAHAENSIRGSV
eukprot:scaffold28197_cov43-Phaeocystis_antarctica.AAC.1